MLSFQIPTTTATICSEEEEARVAALTLQSVKQEETEAHFDATDKNDLDYGQPYSR